MTAKALKLMMGAKVRLLIRMLETPKRTVKKLIQKTQILRAREKMMI